MWYGMREKMNSYRMISKNLRTQDKKKKQNM